MPPDIVPADSPRLAGFLRRHPIATFLAIAYGFSWSLFAVMIASQSIIVPLIVTASFGPSLAAIITHRIVQGNFRAFRILSTWLKVASGTFAGFLLVVFAFVILPTLLATEINQARWGALFSLGVFNVSTLLGGPLGEEPGWRGYLLPRLEKRLGPATGTIFVGLIWTGWHLPLFFVPGWTTSPVWTYALMLCAVSVIMTFGFNLAGFSVIAAIASHAAFNTISKYLVRLLKGAEIQIQISFETLLALCGLAVAFVLLMATRGRLAYPREESCSRDATA